LKQKKVLEGEEYLSPIREATIHNTYASKWGIRKGDWLYINDPSGGHISKNKIEDKN